MDGRRRIVLWLVLVLHSRVPILRRELLLGQRLGLRRPVDVPVGLQILGQLDCSVFYVLSLGFRLLKITAIDP
jgi:hypothetical protein